MKADESALLVYLLTIVYGHNYRDRHIVYHFCSLFCLPECKLSSLNEADPTYVFYSMRSTQISSLSVRCTHAVDFKRKEYLQ